MKISTPGLGGRLQRVRKDTGLSQVAVGDRIGVSWMTVHRWERSQRLIPDDTLDQLCDLYNKPLRWFLTLEEGDLHPENGPSDEASKTAPRASSAAAKRLSSRIAEAPAVHRPMIEKVVEDILDALRQSSYRP